MNHRISPRWVDLPVVLAACLAITGCAAPKPKPQAAPSTPKKPEPPASHTVARGALKRTVTLDAVFESAEMQALKIEPKAWMDWTVLEAVPHGARVKKGDTLIRIDTEKIREQIDDLEQDRPGTVTALEIAQAELENLKETTPQRLLAAKRTARIADEDFTYFQETGKAQRTKGAQFNLKSAEQRLENASEELKQLEKMYKADDLTEETEEIILKRQRFAVEAAQFGLESTKLNTERDLKVFIAREEENLKNQKRDQDLALEFAEQTLQKNLTKKSLDVEKLKRDQRKAQKRLADLKTDLEAMHARAPADGVVYYGACENGKWPTGPMLAKKLTPGGKLTPFEVFMTIVNPAKLQLRAVVPEAELAKVRAGMTGEAALVSAPDKKFKTKLDELGQVPMVTGGFEATLSAPSEATAKLVPGMNCKVTLGGDEKPDKLLAPKEAVFSEGDQKHAFVLKSDGKHEKRSVKIGESDEKMTEIVEGLAEGEKILLKRPE
jgi:RND family efflux transporter MFP subunit